MIAADGNGTNLTQSLIELCSERNMSVTVPYDNMKMCCGLTYDSKGHEKEGKRLRSKTVKMLFDLSNSGEIPIIVDSSPCANHFIESRSFERSTDKYFEKLKFIDLVEFLDIIVEGSKKRFK